MTGEACRPCLAYALTLERYGWAVRPVEAATVKVTWPPDSLMFVFPQCRPTVVGTCVRHERWSLWPIALHMALAIEAEDLTMPEIPAESAMEAMLRQKREQDRSGRIARRHGYGSLPDQSIQVLIDAYLEAGTFGGAARLLNARKVRTWKGGPWSGGTVSAMIRGYPAVMDHVQTPMHRA